MRSSIRSRGTDAGEAPAGHPDEDRQQQQAPAIAAGPTLARFGLSSPDPAVRLGAIQDMLRSLDEPTVALLRERKRRRNRCRRPEGDRHGPGDGRPRRNRLRTRVSQPSRRCRAGLARTCGTSWRSLVEKSPDGTFVESRRSSRRLQPQTRWSTSTRIGRFYSAIETLFFGLSLGSVLVLIAIGLAITFGVMGVINMAHGELMMLGAYTTYVVQVAMPGTSGRVDPGRHSRGVSRRRRCRAC